MATDSDIVLRARAPFARPHDDTSPCTRHPQHRVGSIAIELPVQPQQELLRRRLWQEIPPRHAVDLRLQADMRRRLDLEVTTAFVLVELACQSALDVARAGIMAFDEIAVIGIHDPDEAGQARSRQRMQRAAQHSQQIEQAR